MPAPTLETERLRLVMWRPDHLGALAELYLDADNLKFVGGAKNSLDTWYMLVNRAGHWALYGYGLWAVEQKATACLIGWCGIQKPLDFQHDELGYTIARPFQGLGYAGEAGRAALAWGFDVRRLTGLGSYIDPANVRSVKVAVGLGAEKDGTFDLRGNRCDVYRYRSSGGSAA